MEFKIEKSGCCVHKGLCQIRIDIFEKGKLTTVKVYPKKGYPGEVKDIGFAKVPVSMEDYRKWEESLPTQDVAIPVHSHMIYFDPEHLDDLENVQFCGEIAKNWKKEGKPMVNTYENGKHDPVWKPEK